MVPRAPPDRDEKRSGGRSQKIAIALFGFTSGKLWIYRAMRRHRWKGQKLGLDPPRPTANHRRGLPPQLPGGLQREAQIRSQLRSVPILIPSVVCLGFEHQGSALMAFSGKQCRTSARDPPTVDPFRGRLRGTAMEAGRPRYEAVWGLWPPYGPEDLTMGGAEDLFRPSRGCPNLKCVPREVS